jgi:hypothetical protein
MIATGCLTGMAARYSGFLTDATTERVRSQASNRLQFQRWHECAGPKFIKSAFTQTPIVIGLFGELASLKSPVFKSRFSLCLRKPMMTTNYDFEYIDSLGELDLYRRNLGAVGATALANELGSNSSLRRLWVNHTWLGAGGAAALADAL